MQRPRGRMFNVAGLRPYPGRREELKFFFGLGFRVYGLEVCRVIIACMEGL